MPRELVRGRIVVMNVPAPRHGTFVHGSVVVGVFAEDEHDKGRVMYNDAGVITERDPDTVRGPDFSYYSYDRLPKGRCRKAIWTLFLRPPLRFDRLATVGRLRTGVNELLNAGVRLSVSWTRARNRSPFSMKQVRRELCTKAIY